MIKRPYYYFFTFCFSMFIIIIIGYFFQQKIANTDKNQISFLDKQLTSFLNSSFVHPTYVIADFFDVLKFNFFTNGTKIRNLKIDYERLKHDYSLLKAENTSLANIVHYSPTYGDIIATGRILSDPNGFGAGVFTISVGLKDGVKFGDIVTTEYGLVGKIVKVFYHNATVLPVRHLSAKTIGRVQNQGSLVLMSGRHFKGAVVDYISDTVGLEKGQHILSVSDDKSMPSGIIIGTIIDPYDRPIHVKLGVDFKRLDYITIIRSKALDAGLNNNKNSLLWPMDNETIDNERIKNYTPIQLD
jgi:cell shape-determining protein MreC